MAKKMKRIYESQQEENQTTPKRRNCSSFEESNVENVIGDFSLAANWNGPFPNFCKPKEIGSFSIDEEGIFQNNRTQNRYFYAKQKDGPLPNPFNLNDGFETFIQKDEENKEYLDNILRWITLNFEAFLKTKPKFVCWRGLLTKIAASPYEAKEGWKFAAICINGTVFLCEFETEDRRKRRLEETPQQKLQCYGGWKFEQYLTTASKDGVPNTKEPVNNKRAFVSVVSTKLSQNHLFYAGEVDCLDNSEYVELKTSRELYQPHNQRNFKRFKLLKWWLQSFLIGISRIVAGFKDDEGFVRRIETFRTLQLPKLCEKEQNSWQGNVCFNMLDSFLNHVQNVVDRNSNRISLFEFRPKLNEVFCHVEVFANSEFNFIPGWFHDFWKAQPKGT